MNKKLLIFLCLPLVLAACTKQGPGANDNNPLEDASIDIVDPHIEDFYGNTNLQLAVQTSPENLELTWSSSDEDVASVNNGVVSFKPITEEKNVVIKVASTQKQDLFAEYEFDVKPNPIDLEASDGFDVSNFYTTGMALSASSEKILFKNAASSTFFYKASFKGQLRVAPGEFGFYLYSESSSIENAFLTVGVDGRGRMKEGGFPYLLVTKGDEVTKVTLPAAAAFKEDTYRDFAIGKYGKDLYIFGENQKTLLCAEKFFDAFGDNDNFRVGIYTKGFEIAVKSFVASLDENDVLFGEPTNITLGEDKTVLEGEEFDLQVRGNRLNFNPNKLTYSSSNEDVATVSASGHVVALDDGDVTLKAKYDNKLQAEMNLHVEPIITICSFVLNKDNAPASYDSGLTIIDGNSNSIGFSYSGASASADNHMALADGGYIVNTNRIKSLINIAITGTGTFKLYTGYEAFENIKTFTLDNATEEMELSSVSYFKLEAVGDAVVNTITGTTNGLDTPGKDLVPGEAGSTLMYDCVKWNRLVHDVDASKDFEYSVTFRQITDETNYLKRPAFFIYPAEYDENDEILHTSTSHFFDGTGGYLHIRQTNSQLCHKTHTNTEKTICTSDAWINNQIIGTKEATIGGLWGLPGEEATTTTQSRVTRDCILTLTFTLQNIIEDGVRHQHWSVKIDCESFATISGVNYSGEYTKTYTLDSTEGNVFPCERIGIAIGHGYAGTYKVLSASSVGVR